MIESSIDRMIGNVFHRKKRDDGSGGWKSKWIAALHKDGLLGVQEARTTNS